MASILPTLHKTEGKRLRPYRLVRLVSLLFWPLLAPGTTFSQAGTRKQHQDLAKEPFATILKNYQFIGDFTQYEAITPISKEFFWRYPFPLPKARLTIEQDLGDADHELPAPQGTDRATQHMNYGRILFRQKNYEKAGKVWLTARSRFGQSFKGHRRNDYFISLAYLKTAEQLLRQFNGQFKHPEVRLSYSNAATFLSWAFVKKAHTSDPALDRLTPKALYNLAAIYFRFNRYNSAHSTARMGLDYLRKTGRSEYRPQFRRIVLESWIRDHNYLRAIQEIDTMIRQDPEPVQAGFGFARAGDIYFDLNNYALAEESYRLSQSVHFRAGKILPLSFLLRGESLFWLGKFSEAQKVLRFGLDSLFHKKAAGQVSKNFRPWGLLRLADAWLARFRQASEKGEEHTAAHAQEQARINYFKVKHEFPGSEASDIAQVRLACLLLPDYRGNNVDHARKLLKSVVTGHYPTQLLELAGSCEVLSFASREKNQLFVDKLRAFYQRFPKSQFLARFLPYLTELRKKHLSEYLDAEEDHKAMIYLEKNRKKLFKTIPDRDRSRLFLAYLRSKQPEKAQEFFQKYLEQSPPSPLKDIYLALFLAEITEVSDSQDWQNLQQKQAAKMDKDPPRVKKTREITRIFHRILRTNALPLYQEWMYQLASGWSGASSPGGCDTIYPLLSRYRIPPNDRQKMRMLWERISDTISGLLPELFSQNLSCSQAWLDLEQKIALKGNYLEEYGEHWTARLDWPHKKITAPIIWLAAKSLLKRDRGSQTASTLLKYLSGLPEDEFSESGFARALLDRRRTEFGRLWDGDGA